MSTISVGTTNVNSFIVSTDTTGNLVLQTAGTTTALTLDSSQNATFAANVSVKNSGGVYTDVAKGVAKAWVNFQGGRPGTTSGVINSSFNVSSITVNATGSWTVNITTALPNANYSVQTSVDFNPSSPLNQNVIGYYGTRTTSAVNVYSNVASDGVMIGVYDYSVSIFSS
jgi:hypothetical protein